MAASDRLRDRRARKSAYGGEEGQADARPSSGMEDRSFQLTDEELQSLGGTYQPGQEAQCLVTGRIGKDGKLAVSRVEPAGGGAMGQGQGPQAPIVRTNPMMMPG